MCFGNIAVIYNSILTLLGFFCLASYCVVALFKEIREKWDNSILLRIAYVAVYLLIIGASLVTISYEVVFIIRDGVRTSTIGHACVLTMLYVLVVGSYLHYLKTPRIKEVEFSIKERIVFLSCWCFILISLLDGVKSNLMYIFDLDNESAFELTEKCEVKSEDAPFSGGTMNLTMPKAVVLLGAKLPKDVGPVKYVGTGIIIKKRLEGKERVLLLTARHVATTVISMRNNLELGVIVPDGIQPTTVSNRVWLADERTSEDIAMLDLTELGFEDCAIDFDGGGVIKIAEDGDFENGRFKKGCKAFAVSGEVKKTKIALRPGWYLQAHDGMRIFCIASIHGNSGSPIFLYVDNTVYFAGILTLSLGEKQRLTAAEPLTNVIRLLEQGYKAGYFERDIREGQSSEDFSRGCELMRRKNVPHGYVGPSCNTWLLPHAFVSQGRLYKVVLKAHKSLEFNILDENDDIVVEGCRYLTMPSEFDARIHAFQFACTNRNLTMDEIEKRVRCKVTNGDINAIELVGVSGAYYYQKDVVLLLFRHPQGEGSTIAEDLVNAMRRDL